MNSAGRLPSGNCQPPQPDPLYEQACDEVGKAFDVIPASVMEALTVTLARDFPDWYPLSQSAWVEIRRDELAEEENERRISSEEP